MSEDGRVLALCEAYARDVIELDVFEEFVGAIVAGKSVALPYAVMCLMAPGPPSVSNMSAVLKEAWSAV